MRLSGTPVDYFVAKLRINYTQGGGWVEKYNLPLASRGSIMSTLTGLVAARYSCLAGNFTIPFASASQQSISRDSIVPITLNFTPSLLLAVSGSPGTNETTAELCNNAETGLEVTFECDSGVRTVRTFRGIRDSWQNDEFPTVVNLGFPVSLTGAYAGIAAPQATNGSTPWAALQAMLGYIGDNTVFVQPGTVPGPSPYMGGIVQSYKRYYGGILRVRHVGLGWSAQRARRKRVLVLNP